MSRERLVAAARGDLPLDVAVLGVNLVNVHTAQVYPADIGILGDRFAVVMRAGQASLEARQVIDGAGLWAAPGFFDTHAHIESMMVTPPEFAAAVVRFGTTSVAIDPHEIANVLGEDGVRYMVEAARDLPVRIFTCVPSCVPAVPSLETAGAAFDGAAVARMLEWRGVVGVAELMDFVGVIRQEPRMRDIVDVGLARGVVCEGHAPLVSGRDLMAYRAAGVESDHESREAWEVLEKAEAGTQVHIRESSLSKNAAVAVEAWRRVPAATNFDMCTDDIDPEDALARGHLNRVVRRAIECGMPPPIAIRCASLAGARFYRRHDLGAIAPGMRADLLLLTSLEDVAVRDVWVDGRRMVAEGRLVAEVARRLPPPLDNTVRIPPLTADDLVPAAPVEEGEAEAHVLVLNPSRRATLSRLRLRVGRGRPLLPLPDGALLLAVVGRHGAGRPPALGFLSGLGLRRGAMATTVAHDSHHLVVAGHDPGDMLRCVEELRRCGGGFCLVEDGRVRALVELPVAGLMSPDPVERVAERVAAFNRQAIAMGVTSPTTPILALSSVALPVSPFFRITDRGLVDVVHQRPVPLFPQG
jgi:adenine deaminase